MLNRKGLNDMLHEKRPNEDHRQEADPQPSQPLADSLDYGLMDDLPSGKDSFFHRCQHAQNLEESPGPKCPGFANQRPETDCEYLGRAVLRAKQSEDYLNETAPDQALRQTPAVDFGVYESTSMTSRRQCHPAGPNREDPDSPQTISHQEQLCRDCPGRDQRPEPHDPAPSSEITHDPQPNDIEPQRPASHKTIEDPIIAPDEFSVTEKTERRCSSWSQLKDHKFLSNSGRIFSHILAVSKDYLKTNRRTVAPAIAAVLLLMAFLYLAQPKPYSVETRLLFISGDGRNPDLQGWSLDKETKYFNNTNVVYTLAQKLFEVQAGPSAAPRPQNPENSVVPHRPRKVVSDGRDRLKNPGEFIKWFVKASSLETDSSAVPARITLRLTGKDPKFLKAVSENYVRSYVEFRRTVPTPVVSQVSSSNPSDNTAVPPVLKTINERLQAFDIQEREYELALNLIDSAKSHFAGFIPKESMVEANSLAHFQQKIVQLELTKNSLSLKYAPESREVRTVEAEIQAARKAMRQCLVEQLRFVKHNRELLLTQKMELEKGIVSPTDVKPQPQQPQQIEPSRQVVTADAPVPLGNGLYLIWDSPSLTEKPLLSKVGDATGSVVTGVQQSIDSVRDAKDSLITGLYNSLVSENARGVEGDPGEDPSPKPNGRYIVRQ